MADPEFIASQRAFTAWLRAPDAHPPPPDIAPERLKVYRELFFGSINGLLAGAFPMLRRQLGDAGWRALVSRFRQEHACQTPLFPQIGAEFVDWLQQLDAAQKAEVPPWQFALAHYERMQAELLIDDAPLPPHQPDGDLLHDIPVLCPTVRALAYAWPVHQPEQLGPQPPAQPTLLLMQRRQDGNIHTRPITPLLYRLLDLLDAGQASGQQCLQRLADEAQVPNSNAFLREGARMLQQLRQQGVILGTAVDS